MSRYALLVLLSALCAGQASAQLVGKKDLVTAVGIGGAWGELRSPLRAFDVPGAYGGNFSFAFGYAFNTNWGMGIRYDRLGFAESVDTMAQARIALLHVHGTYRPWQTDLHAIEVETGFGSSAFAFRGLNERLPQEANSWSANGSVRYLRQVHKSILGFVALRGHTTGRAVLSRSGAAGAINEDTSLTVHWRAVMLTFGLAVRW
ncbi:MAG: hypothetical protein IPJ76_16400 [Flavobacteriales bacterium]|nr:MAG: hypothetical protein IPJ76_16400 [Flavobacteriales bacterium]